MDKHSARQVHALVVAAYTGDLAAVTQLLGEGAVPDDGDYDGRTALQVGAEGCWVLSWLQEWLPAAAVRRAPASGGGRLFGFWQPGAPAGSKHACSPEATLLQVACSRGQESVVAELLKAGATPLRPCLLAACREKYFGIVDLLVSPGAAAATSGLHLPAGSAVLWPGTGWSTQCG
jgi:hypothetical protein